MAQSFALIAALFLCLATVLPGPIMADEVETGIDPLHFECCRDAHGNPYGLYDGSICPGSMNQEVLIHYSPSGITWYNEDYQCGTASPVTVTASANLLVATIPVGYEGSTKCVGGKLVMNIQSDRVALMDYELFQDGSPSCPKNAFVILCDNCAQDTGGGGTGGGGGGSCFSEQALVSVQGKGSVAMKDLKVGDWVLVQTDHDSKNKYEPVYAFGHYNPTKEQSFLQIHYTTNTFLSSEEVLEITKDHLIFLKGQANPVRADSIQVGDELLFPGTSTTNEKIDAAAKVTRINTVSRTGVYTPLTPSGKVVVNGIVASSYIALQDSDDAFLKIVGGWLQISHSTFAHLYLAPFRMTCMGISTGICKFYTVDGIPPYIDHGMKLAHWVDQQHDAVQVLMLGVSLPIVLPLAALEVVFGVSIIPLLAALSIMAVAVGTVKKNVFLKVKVC